jgi:hypothetical protein
MGEEGMPESYDQWEERLLREVSSVEPVPNALIERRVNMLSPLGAESWRFIERHLAHYFESGVLSEQKAIDATEALHRGAIRHLPEEDQMNLKAAMSLQARAFWRGREWPNRPGRSPAKLLAGLRLFLRD